MRKFFTALTAVAVTASAIAQITGTLNPDGGKFYAGDLKYNGYIGIEYSAPVGHTEVTDSSYVAVPPVATISVNNQTIVLDAFEIGNTGYLWSIAVQDTVNKILPQVDQFYPMTVTVTATDPGTSVETLTGSYEYNPVFPYTGATPEAGDSIASKTQTVVFNFNQPVTYSGVVITSGSVTTTLDGGSSVDNKVTVSLEESYWAAASASLNSINVTLNGVTLSNGETISNVPDEAASISVGYVYEENIALPTYYGVEQDPYWWLAQDLFGESVTFMYNAEVSIANATAVVTFADEFGEIEDTELTLSAAAGQITGAWNIRGNYYSVNVRLPLLDYTADDFLTMTVTLSGVSADVQPVSVTYDSKFDDDIFFAPKKDDAAGISVTPVNDNKADVYNLSGKLVVKNATPEMIKSLDKGIYIANGKKILVK